MPRTKATTECQRRKRFPNREMAEAAAKVAFLKERLIRRPAKCPHCARWHLVPKPSDNPVRKGHRRTTVSSMLARLTLAKMRRAA